MDNSPNNKFSTPAQFRSKLGTYLTGVIIGFLLLGAIYYQKHLASKYQQAQRDSQVESDTPTPSTDPQSTPPSTRPTPNTETSP